MQLQVGVKVLLMTSEGKILFIRRRESLGNGGEVFWDIPGGRIESDESVKDALVREVREETAIHLDASPILLAAQDIFVPAKDLHVVRLTYKADSIEQSVQTSDEHTESQWLTINEALAENIDPYISEVLQQEERNV